MSKISDEVLALLGGVDCGACGYATCQDCANAISDGESGADACVIIDASAVDQIQTLIKK
jgi:Na+-translocating ferredoxin:NAD+ oxidoreductase RNF subunit RnfB